MAKGTIVKREKKSGKICCGLLLAVVMVLSVLGFIYRQEIIEQVNKIRNSEAQSANEEYSTTKLHETSTAFSEVDESTTELDDLYAEEEDGDTDTPLEEYTTTKLYETSTTFSEVDESTTEHEDLYSDLWGPSEDGDNDNPLEENTTTSNTRPDIISGESDYDYDVAPSRTTVPSKPEVVEKNSTDLSEHSGDDSSGYKISKKPTKMPNDDEDYADALEEGSS